MKGLVRVTENDGSNMGLRRPGEICFALHGASRAQGTRQPNLIEQRERM